MDETEKRTLHAQITRAAHERKPIVLSRLLKNNPEFIDERNEALIAAIRRCNLDAVTKLLPRADMARIAMNPLIYAMDYDFKQGFEALLPTFSNSSDHLLGFVNQAAANDNPYFVYAAAKYEAPAKEALFRLKNSGMHKHAALFEQAMISLKTESTSKPKRRSSP